MTDAEVSVKRGRIQSAVYNATRAKQERVVPSMNNRSMCLNCDANINSLDLNRGQTQVVIAGRQVLKILSIGEDRFQEVMNLRVSKNKNANLDYCTADVAWNPVNEQILASASTNGSVVIWNLTRQTENILLKEHQRTVNRVAWHPVESNQLLSGSHDGTTKLHDLRANMSPLCFQGRSSESVRDVQFACPTYNYFAFGTASESGIVEVWDIRRPDRSEKCFTAHNEPALALDWCKEGTGNALATAGRDGLIKVWDLSKACKEPGHTVHTVAPVSRVRWRPGCMHHIASCQLLTDYCINVWDVRRPYMSFASFTGHKDIVTCILWKDTNTMLSCGRDGLIIQHLFSDAKKMADASLPCGLQMSVLGDIGFVCRERNIDTSKKSSGQLPHRELFPLEAHDILTIFDSFQETDDEEMESSGGMKLTSEDVTMSSFLQMAKEYRLKGPAYDLCEHNSGVAASANRPQISYFWKMLIDTFHLRPDVSQAAVSDLPRSSYASDRDLSRGMKGTLLSNFDGLHQPHLDIKKVPVWETSSVVLRSKATNLDSEADSLMESCVYGEDFTNIARGTNQSGGQFFEEASEESPYLFGFNMGAADDWAQLPDEAFQPRHELNSLQSSLGGLDHDSMLVAKIESDVTPNTAAERNQFVNGCSTDLIVDKSAIYTGPVLNFTHLAVQCMSDLCDQGDVQTAVTMIIVLKDYIAPHLDVNNQINWFHCYIDLLRRFQLWNIANHVIMLSHLPQISQLNQMSTLFNLACPNCQTLIARGDYCCRKCRKQINICSICHEPVKGLMMWCQGCQHGGHLKHMMEWFSTHDICPAICGHHC